MPKNSHALVREVRKDINWRTLAAEAVAEENYELASELRDKIKEIEGNRQ